MLRLLSYLRRWGDGPAPRYEVPCGCGRRPARRPAEAASGPPLSRLRPEGLRPGEKPASASGGKYRRESAFTGPPPERTWRVATSARRRGSYLGDPACDFYRGGAVPRPAGPAARPRRTLSGPRGADGRRPPGPGARRFSPGRAGIANRTGPGPRRPDALSSADCQELVQLERQSDLLSRLSSRSLQEIVGEADPVLHDEEWKARFARDYEGQSLLFDDAVRFDDSAPDDRPAPSAARQLPRRGGRQDGSLGIRGPRHSSRSAAGTASAAAVRRPAGEGGTGRKRPVDGGIHSGQRRASDGSRGRGSSLSAAVNKDLLDVLKRQEEWLRRPTP